LPAKPRTEIAHPARTAAFIYGGIAVVAAVAFILVTTFTGDYPLVARYGGAAWIFLLLMIVLMPIVIPRAQKRGKKPPEPPVTGASEPMAACPIEEPVACPVDMPTTQPDIAERPDPQEDERTSER
jgi:hypothetical protein